MSPTRTIYYHWRELPQVSFLSREKYACRDIPCCDKIMFVATKYFCRGKTFVTTNIFRDKGNFSARKLLLRQKYACRDKTFVLTNTCLSRQNICRDKQNFCRDKHTIRSRAENTGGCVKLKKVTEIRRSCLIFAA